MDARQHRRGTFVRFKGTLSHCWNLFLIPPQRRMGLADLAALTKGSCVKRHKCGLIVGKFAPLHLGHDFMIRRGLEECEELVILSYSNPEFPEFPPEMRRAWLNELYPSTSVIVLDRTTSHPPENSAEDSVHRDFVSKIFFEKFGKPLDVVYTSESYGDGFAERLSQNLMNWKVQSRPVAHVNVDQERIRFPISGTRVRSALHESAHHLPRIVYSSLVKSVCFLGAESTGKSTLTCVLAKKMNTSFADEYGRTLWEQKKGNLEFSDFLQIAKKQIEKENEARLTARRIFFADTSPLTTLFYSEFYCRRVDPALFELSFRTYDRVFLCLPDFPLVQDGTRLDESFRLDQHHWYLRVLKERNVPFETLGGSLENRIKKVIDALSEP
jgi:HTH-type transcriptional repressor of NAD biosynthesis genes